MDAVCPVITDEMFRIFHAIDRELYSILVFQLGHDPFESVWIIALWLWLERAGFNNVVQKIISLPRNFINGLAGDASACLKCIRDTISLFSPAPCEILLTQRILGKPLSLRFFLENHAQASLGIKDVVAEVCVRALTDLMEMAMLPRPGEGPTLPFRQMGPKGKMGTRGPRANVVPQDERTMFATFSKGYPVAEWEVRGFFSKVFGNCIESVQMQPVKPREHALYARIVFFNPALIDLILNGEKKAKYTINGKHVWLRKFVPRKNYFPVS